LALAGDATSLFAKTLLPRGSSGNRELQIACSPLLTFTCRSEAGWQARIDSVLKDYVDAHFIGEAKGVNDQSSEDVSGGSQKCQGL
jgi:hypothetical protein